MSLKTRKLIVTALIMSLVMQVFTGLHLMASEDMSDISGHWAKTQVESLVASGAITGYPDGTFLPDNTMTRAEFIAVVTRLLDLNQETTYAFSDVPWDHWSNGYVGAALDYELIDLADYYDDASGTYDFLPNQNITRGEIAEIVVKALGNTYAAETFSGSLNGFSDGASIPADQSGYVDIASEEGIITGYPNGTFGAAKTATRAEASVMLIRMETSLASKPEKSVVDSEDIYAFYSQNVVKIYLYDSYGYDLGTGSGFVLNQDGDIVTNYHVIEEAYTVEVEFYDGTRVQVESVVNYDVSRDVAVINIGNIQTDVVPVRIGNDRDVNIGSTVYAIGYPLGQGLTITDGLISSEYYEVYDELYLQISAPISPGNSGGPLVNKYGEVIGINTLASSLYAQNMNYTIPISLIGDLLTTDNTISMVAFAERDTDIMSRLNVNVDDVKVYGVDSITGEKVYADKNHFDLNEVYNFGVEVTLSHDRTVGDSAIYVSMDIYDGDYDYYDYMTYNLNLSGGTTTILDLPYESYYSYLSSGYYYLELYLGDSGYLLEGVSFDDHTGFGDYVMTETSISTYDVDLYNSDYTTLYSDRFDVNSLSGVGIEHTMTFSEMFYSYHSFLVRYEVTGPNDVTDVLYDTLFGASYSYSGTNSFTYYGSEDVPLKTGNYIIKAFVGDELVDEGSFYIGDINRDTINDIEVEEVRFYDYYGEEPVDFAFDDYYYPAVVLSFGDITQALSLEVGYAIRGEGATKASIIDDIQSYDIAVYTEMSGETEEVYLPLTDVPTSFYNGGLSAGEAIVMDIYVGGRYKDTVEIHPGVDYEEAMSINRVSFMASPFSNEEVMELGSDAVYYVGEYYDVEEPLVTATDLITDHLSYVIWVNEPGETSSIAMTYPIELALYKDADGSLVATSRETSAVWTDLSYGIYINSFELESGSSYDAGNYTLKVYYGDAQKVIYEQAVVIAE